MPTTYPDQFWLLDPFAPPPVGTTLNVANFDIVDQNDNGLINAVSGDSVNGSVITQAYPGDTVTADFGSGPVLVTGSTFYLANGSIVFTPTDGTVLGTATLVTTTFVTTQGNTPVGDLSPPCFVHGTLIAVEGGTKRVEELVVGDRVKGYDGQYHALRKVLNRRLGVRELWANPKLLPVRITAGAMGQGMPTRDLLVSRQHRMLLRSPIAKRMFGVAEVLVAAIKLVDLPGIFVDDDHKSVHYFHLIFDEHLVIYAEDAPTESLYAGAEALKSMGDEAREELLTLFPELLDQDFTAKPARPIPGGKRQKQLAARHLKNNKPLFDAHV
jgi:hypothetical protein